MPRSYDRTGWTGCSHVMFGGLHSLTGSLVFPDRLLIYPAYRAFYQIRMVGVVCTSKRLGLLPPPSDPSSSMEYGYLCDDACEFLFSLIPGMRFARALRRIIVHKEGEASGDLSLSGHFPSTRVVASLCLFFWPLSYPIPTGSPASMLTTWPASPPYPCSGYPPGDMVLQDLPQDGTIPGNRTRTHTTPSKGRGRDTKGKVRSTCTIDRFQRKKKTEEKKRKKKVFYVLEVLDQYPGM